MTEVTVQRRLAAILAADVVGYSAMMERAEEWTYARFEKFKRDLVEPSLLRHHGRLIKTTGDGALAEFASPLAALRSALEMQACLSSDAHGFKLRIGINLGDVIVGNDGDLFGDGINIAVRLEGIADPGGILISGKVYSEVEGKIHASFEDRGDRQLKNFSRLVRTYAVLPAVDRPATPTFGLLVIEPPVGSPTASLALPDKPSIAVLPFNNLSSDLEQEYFTDGMVDDIITALSRFQWLFVIGRTSTFSYKGRKVDVKQVSRELGVRYVVDGSVRKSGSRVRIAPQLIDATTRVQLWSDRYEGTLENIFELQDQVASGVAGAINPRLREVEIARVKRKPPASYDAYDCFLRASVLVHQWTAEAHEDALRLLYRAIKLDPDYGPAYALATAYYCFRKVNGPVTEPAIERRETERLAREAIRLGKDDAFSLSCAGHALAMVVGELNEGAALIERALALNPNLAQSWNMSGWVKLWLNQPLIAIEHFARAMRLSPMDVGFHSAVTGTAFAYLRAGRYEEASLWAEKAWREQPGSADAVQAVALSSAFAGDVEKATAAVRRLVEIAPKRRISTALVSKNISAKRLAFIQDVFRKGGMPE